MTLAIPLLLYCIWHLDEDRIGLFAVYTVLAAATGELIGLTLACLGLWYAFDRRRLRSGLTIAAPGAAWTAFCLAVVIPAFNEGAPGRFYGRFDTVGGSPGGLITTLVTDPLIVVNEVSELSDFAYVVWLLGPTALLVLGTPALLIAVVPQLEVNVLSDFWSTTQPMFQYGAAIIPVLVAATIFTISRLPEALRAPAAAWR